MTGRTHHYQTSLEWLGNRGTGTSGYRDYSRTHVVRADAKPPIESSADVAFRGDADRWNPEELLVASLSQCHMLSYLYEATKNGVVVLAYEDEASGTMVEEGDGGHFTEVTLRPVVTVADASMASRAQSLHHEAHLDCYIASSVNFPVGCEPTVVVAADGDSVLPGLEERSR